ncbi:lysine -specific demethylase 4c [Fusarium albosuccineum]|uniref:Lysine -specific demethylase 4c n=1 Tax=Fusarium albosuccineum TaxID=1237068 RepID=A0A8H4LFR9_9HYPO|nr:lysine -specific demethylase 4c [Fusarium albosuccineum]
MPDVTVEALHQQFTAIAEAIELCRQWAGQSPGAEHTSWQRRDEEAMNAATWADKSKQYDINCMHHLLEPLKNQVVQFALSIQSNGYILQKRQTVTGSTSPAGCVPTNPALGPDDMCTRMTASLLRLSQMRGYGNRVAVIPMSDKALRDIKKHMQMDRDLRVEHNTFHRDAHGCVRVKSQVSEDEINWADLMKESRCPSPEGAAVFVEELVKELRLRDCEPAAYQSGRACYRRNNPSRLHPGEYLEDMREYCELTDEMVYIGRPRSTTFMGKARWNLRSATVGDRGHRVWTLIATTDTDKFRSWVREEWGCPGGDIDINRLGLLIPPSVLDSAGIGYEVWVQSPGMMIITEPGQYHQIISYSTCIERSIYVLFPGEQLELEAEVTLTPDRTISPGPGWRTDISTTTETAAQSRTRSRPTEHRARTSVEEAVEDLDTNGARRMSADTTPPRDLGTWIAPLGDGQSGHRQVNHYSMSLAEVGLYGMSTTITRELLGLASTADRGARQTEVVDLTSHVDGGDGDGNGARTVGRDDVSSFAGSAGQGSTPRPRTIINPIRNLVEAIQSVCIIKRFVSLVHHARLHPEQRTRRPLSQLNGALTERQWVQMVAKRIQLLQASKAESGFGKMCEAYDRVRLWKLYKNKRIGAKRIDDDHMDQLTDATGLSRGEIKKVAYKGRWLANLCKVYGPGLICFIPTSKFKVERTCVGATAFINLGKNKRRADWELFHDMVDDSYMRRICHAGATWLQSLDNGQDIEFTWEGRDINWDALDGFGRAEAVQPKSFTSPNPDVLDDIPDNMSERLDSLINDTATSTYSSSSWPSMMSLGSGGLLDSLSVNVSPVSHSELDATATHPNTTPAGVDVDVDFDFDFDFDFDSDSDFDFDDFSTAIANVPACLPTMTEGLDNSASFDTTPRELRMNMGIVSGPLPMHLVSASEESDIDVCMGHDAGDIDAESGCNVGLVQPLDSNIDMVGGMVLPWTPDAYCGNSEVAWGVGDQYLWLEKGGEGLLFGDLALPSFDQLGCPGPLNQELLGMDISTPWSLVDLGSARAPSDQTYQEPSVGTNGGNNFSMKGGDQQLGLF